MEKSRDIRRPEPQGFKRKAEEDESFSNTSTSSPNKRWKSNLREVGESSKTAFTNKRNTTFANDRLKDLRKKLKTDVVSITSSINAKILEKSRNSGTAGTIRFEPPDEISKPSLVYNPFTRSSNSLFNPIKKYQNEDRVKLPNIKTEFSNSKTVDTTCDIVKVNLSNPELSKNKVDESFINKYNNISPKGSTSSLFCPKKSPLEHEGFQNSANSRLSNLRNIIHKGEKWKEHESFDSNLNVLSPPASISKYPPENRKSFNQRDKETINVVQNRHQSIPNNRHTCNSPNKPLRQETIVSNKNVQNSDCTPSTSKNKCLDNHKVNTTSLEKNRNIHDQWNDKNDYGQIIDSLYKKYFENSENLGGILDKSSQTTGENEPTDCAMDWEDDDILDPPPNSELKKGVIESKELHFVVDTNVFIHDLNILQDIIDKSKGNIKPIIYLPWMVISELDFIKDDKKSSSVLKSKVQKAVRYINENILGGKSSIKGQTIHEVDEQKFVGKSPDDKILSCCLLVKEKYHKVIFVSNDCLLRNKVLINGIPALSTSEILKPSVSITDLSPASKKLQEKTQKALEEMSTCCSFIICECAREAYGRVWNKMSMLSNPPWSLKICLKIFRKYWRGIFQEKFLKQFMQSVEKLEKIHKDLETHKTPKNFDEFVDAYLELCFFFKDLEEHKAFVETSIKDVKSIAYID